VANMDNKFKNILKGKTVIVGIGNILRTDDAFGSLLIEKLNGKVKAVCLDAGSAPENYIGRIAREDPDTVLIVDAVHLELEPGEYRILRSTDLANIGLTTHDISPSTFIDYLKEQTKAEIYILGVQPAKVSFGEGLSDKMAGTLEQINRLITETLNA
jgi:hydrogenase 3 maturation protease